MLNNFYKETPAQRLERVRNEQGRFRPRRTKTKAELKRKIEKQEKEKLKEYV